MSTRFVILREPPYGSEVPVPGSHDVRIVTQGPTSRLVLTGEIDLAAAPEVAVAVDQVLAGRPELVILDLSATAFLDSAGIGTLVGLSNSAAEAEIRVQLEPGPPNVMRVLELVGLTETFPAAEAVNGATPREDHA